MIATSMFFTITGGWEGEYKQNPKLEEWVEDTMPLTMSLVSLETHYLKVPEGSMGSGERSVKQGR